MEKRTYTLGFGDPGAILTPTCCPPTLRCGFVSFVTRITDEGPRVVGFRFRDKVTLSQLGPVAGICSSLS